MKMLLYLRRVLVGTVLFVGGPLLCGQSLGTPPVVIQNAGSQIGAAAILNFSTGTTVSCSGGICTVTASGTGGPGNPGVYIPVSFSATPTFTATSNTINSFSITLTGNVTSSTLAGSAAGQELNFEICQDGTGGRTFVWPTGFSLAMTISPTLNSCSIQSFFWDGSNAQPKAPGTVTVGAGYIGVQAAPLVNPATGFIKSWCDSTDLDCEILNASGKTFAMALKGGDYNPVTGVVTAINGTAFPASATLIGSNASSQPISQTATVATAFLNVFSNTLKGLAPLSGGGTANYLRADGTWATPPGTGLTGTCATGQVCFGGASAVTSDSGFTVAGDVVTAAGFAGSGSNPFINLPSNTGHSFSSGDLVNNAGTLQFNTGSATLPLVTNPFVGQFQATSFKATAASGQPFLLVSGSPASFPGVYGDLVTDTQSRVGFQLNGSDMATIFVGPGGATMADTVLYRVSLGVWGFSNNLNTPNTSGSWSAANGTLSGTLTYNGNSPPTNSVVCYKAGGVMGYATNTAGVIGTTCN